MPRAEPGFEAGSNVLHLTRTLLGSRAYCGARCNVIGVPEDAVICQDCNTKADEEGAVLGLWAAMVAVTGNKEQEKPSETPKT